MAPGAQHLPIKWQPPYPKWAKSGMGPMSDSQFKLNEYNNQYQPDDWQLTSAGWVKASIGQMSDSWHRLDE